MGSTREHSLTGDRPLAREEIERLLDRFEAGQIGREDLLGALASTDASASVGDVERQGSTLRGRARSINHVNIFVADLARSVTFYRELGLPFQLRPIRSGQGRAAYALDFEDGSFISLIVPDNPADVGKIDHFCIGLSDVDAAVDREGLRRAGIASVPLEWPGVSSAVASELDGARSPSLGFVRDPDGVLVQLADASYRFDCPNGIGFPPCAPVPAAAPGA